MGVSRGNVFQNNHSGYRVENRLYKARVANGRPVRKCLLWSRYAMTEKL